MRTASLIANTLVPTFHYRDPAAMVDWLCAAFGFETCELVAGVDGSFRHALLSTGGNLIMLLPARAGPGGANAIDGQKTKVGAVAPTQSCYFVVPDADLHFLNAKAHGAEVLDVGEYQFGGRGYSCRDAEGHVWHFGTRNLGRETSLPFVEGLARLRGRVHPRSLAALVLVLLLVTGTTSWMLAARPLSKSVETPTAETSGKGNSLMLAAEHRAHKAALREATEAAEMARRQSEERGAELAKIRSQKDTAERSVQSTLDQLARERAAREAAEQAVKDIKKRLAEAANTRAIEPGSIQGPRRNSALAGQGPQ
jgi:uncharacterized glyoxalase superfamily protein PhnB